MPASLPRRIDIEGGAFRTELHACFPRRAGALFVDKDVPAGFQAIRVAFNVQAPEASAEQLASLAEKTER
jgi:hypothetical protein